MHALIVLILIPFVLGDVIVVDNDMTRPKPRCPGGYKEGEEAVLGRYFYQCQEGMLEPKGCISDQGTRVDLWGTADTKNRDYKVKCVRDSRNFIQFEYVSCLYEGREYGINERWRDDKYIYICLKDGDHLRMDIDGCMYEGREVSINGKMRKDNFVYQCKQTENGTCSMCPVGCVKSDREFMIGETMDDNRFWYTCSNENGRIALKVNGCVSQGRRLKDGEHFFKNSIAYECQVNKDDILEKIVGCAQLDAQGQAVERRLDFTWTDGQYDYTCKLDQDGKGAKMIKARCNYKVSNGMLTVDPGCYRIQDGTAVGCLKDGTDNLRIKLYRVDEIGTATAEGLRFC